MSRKLVQKLALKKHREETGLFIVEGEKNLIELLGSELVIQTLYATQDTLAGLSPHLESYRARFPKNHIDLVSVSEETLHEYGTFETNSAGIAIALQPDARTPEEIIVAAKSGLVLVLDDIHDPGNLGTIIRTADWFGVTHIVASETTTDTFNPKTIAASMGSFTRVPVTRLSLPTFLESAQKSNITTYGAYLDGVDAHTVHARAHGIIVMGSESHGISETLLPYIAEKITIPRYGNAESLNVGIATGIILNVLARESDDDR